MCSNKNIINNEIRNNEKNMNLSILNIQDDLWRVSIQCRGQFSKINKIYLFIYKITDNHNKTLYKSSWNLKVLAQKQWDFS
jgi:hypothetical protein